MAELTNYTPEEEEEEEGEEEEYDDAPLVTLKTALNLEELLSGDGAEFEVDEMDNVNQSDEIKQYGASHVYKYYKEDILDREEEEEEDGNHDNLSQFERMAMKMIVLTPDGGVKKQTLQQGVGEVVPLGAHVTVHYNAYFEYADEPFDSTRLCKKPYSFDLGAGKVVPGFELAINSMRKKEQARFLVEPRYAYGDTGCPPRIPGGATCLYVIELLNFVDFGGVGEYFALPMSERKDASLDLVLKAVKKIKDEAKSHFLCERIFPAIKEYRKAVRILEEYHMKDENEENKQQQLLLQLYQNLALCNLKIGHCGRVIQNANEALKIDPNSSKALYFKGKALRQQGYFDKAKVELLKARALKPKSTEIAGELEKLERSSQLLRTQQKELCQRMFSQSNSKEKNESKNFTDVPENEISKMFEENLKLFVDDPELIEIPYSTASLSLQELQWIKSISKGMGLQVFEKQQGNNTHIRVCKRKTLED